MKAILVNYSYDPQWLKTSGLDYLIFDRSQEPLTGYPNTFYTKNIGNVDYDKLNYLVNSYDNLPDVFLWGKTNIFKYVEEDQLKKRIKAKRFSPLIRQDHKTYSDKDGVVCLYDVNGMYWERNNSWFVHEMEHRVNTFEEFAKIFDLPNPVYIPFAPGGNYILTKERVHRYPRSLYKKMRDLLPYTSLPAEAHMCERAYYMLWH